MLVCRVSAEFVDKKDSSLAFAAFGAATHHSYPLAVVQVSPDGLPLEFMLCFHGNPCSQEFLLQNLKNKQQQQLQLAIQLLYTAVLNKIFH